jgi:CRP-like cAMP-binding protein
MPTILSAAAFRDGGSHALVRKLEMVLDLTFVEREALLDLHMNVVEVKPGQDILHQGDRPNRCCTILEGFAATTKVIREGRRQIVAIHLRGDIPDLQSLHLDVMDIGISTLSRCTVGFIQHDTLIGLCEQNPRLSAAIWRESLVYASSYREWIVNIGQRQAYGRMANFLCEAFARMSLVGLVAGDTCTFPITQHDLADILGTSNIHVNRTLQDLRASGLVSWKGQELIVHDWAGLQEAAGFDPTFLHLTPAQKAMVGLA